MDEILVPRNIWRFQTAVAAEMSTRDPLDPDKVKAIGQMLVPAEVFGGYAVAAERQGVSVEQYIIDASYRQVLTDLTGSPDD